jgi:hypothetical protein
VTKSRRTRWVGYLARMGEMRNTYKILVGKTEEKNSFGRNRRRWEYNIKMNLKLTVNWTEMLMRGFSGGSL